MNTSDSKRTVRVRVVVEIEIDRDEYEAEYGEDATVADVRDHIKTAAVSAVESDLNSGYGRIVGWK